MTEQQLIDLGFQSVYIDENADIIDEESVDLDNIYFWYQLILGNKMQFQSNPNEDIINDNWNVDLGFKDDIDMNGFEIESYETIKSIIDSFKTIKLK